MKIRKRALLALLLASCLASAFAQTSEAGSDSVFAPFPSKLRASLKEGDIALSWLDSPDVKAGYAVYRSGRKIDGASFASALRLGRVASGVQSYIDSGLAEGEYYYAVLALAEDASPYPVFIPARNTTALGIAIAAPAPRPQPAQEQSPAPPKASTAAAKSLPQSLVSGLSAAARGDAIIVSYKAPPKSRLVLYRGSSPISLAADLLDATLVSAFSDKDGSFADYPVPGVDYYYALLGEEDLKSGSIVLSPGVNSLKAPVQVRAAALSSGFGEIPPSSRTPPLPYFLIEDGAAGKAAAPLDEGPPPERAVSPETAKAISLILAKSPIAKTAAPEVLVLPEEKSAPAGGEDYALSLIVSSKIAAKDWDSAIDQLRKYLSLNRGPKAQARAHFYLGEALAFGGSARDSFFEFLSARDFYPTESKPWIEYSLRSLALQD